MSSQKRFMVISVVGIVAVVAGLSYLTYRLVAGSGIAASLPRGSAERTIEAGPESVGRETVMLDTSSVDLSGIESVSVRGGWDLVVRSGDARQLLVEVTEAHADRVVVRRTGDVLELRVAENTNYTRARFRAEISVPAVAGIDISGLANLAIDELSSEQFSVRVEGAANVEATDSTFGSLILSVEGAANVDFSASVATSVSVDVAGLASVDVRLDGGVLDGSLEGLARLTYRGTVSRVAVNTEDGGVLRAVNVDQVEEEAGNQ